MALLKLEDISEAWIYIFIFFICPKQFSKKPTKNRQLRAIEQPKNGQIGGNPQDLEILSTYSTKPAHSVFNDVSFKCWPILYT